MTSRATVQPTTRVTVGPNAGKILIAGGPDETTAWPVFLNSTELYDPATFAPTLSGQASDSLRISGNMTNSGEAIAITGSARP
jgi:hypothetical protein